MWSHKSPNRPAKNNKTMPNATIDGGTNGATQPTATVRPPMGALPNEQNPDDLDRSHLTEGEMATFLSYYTKFTKINQKKAADFEITFLNAKRTLREQEKEAARCKDTESTDQQTVQTEVETGGGAPATPTIESVVGKNENTKFGDDVVEARTESKEPASTEQQFGDAAAETALQSKRPASTERTVVEGGASTSKEPASTEQQFVDAAAETALQSKRPATTERTVGEGRASTSVSKSLNDTLFGDSSDEDNDDAENKDDEGSKDDDGSKQGLHSASQLSVDPMIPEPNLTPNEERNKRMNKRNVRRRLNKNVKNRALINRKRGGSRLVDHGVGCDNEGRKNQRT